MRAIAAGRGDSYLIALNQAISAWGKGIYARPMAEMNNPDNLYAGYALSGAPSDAAHSRPARAPETRSSFRKTL